MKKRIILGMVIFLTVCFSQFASAELYKSKSFPSNEILLKAYNSFHSSDQGDPAQPLALEIIGKYQGKSGW